MKSLVVVLLILFVIVDVFLFIFLLGQRSSNNSGTRTVTVITSLKSKTATLVDKNYIYNKANQLSLWNVDRVNTFIGTRPKGTINHLVIELVEVPQNYGAIYASASDPSINYSYGQKFDPASKTMKLLVHVNPALQNKKTFSYHYTYSTLMALYDLVRPYPIVQSHSNDNGLLFFMMDFNLKSRVYDLFNK